MVAKDVEQMQRPNDRGGRHLLGEAIYSFWFVFLSDENAT
jgi:hypothetical protein